VLFLSADIERGDLTDEESVLSVGLPPAKRERWSGVLMIPAASEMAHFMYCVPAVRDMTCTSE